jgi:hypothetical protein
MQGTSEGLTEIYQSVDVILYCYIEVTYCDMSASCWVAWQGLRNKALLGSVR